MIKPLTKHEFDKLKDLIVNACGIFLEDDKDYLVESRLTDFGNELGANSFGELHSMIIADQGKHIPTVIDLMTTNETFWFRDDSIWSTLNEDIIPKYIDKLKSGEMSSVRIWSAASSTGQEAYSLSMMIRELTTNAGVPHLAQSFKILATDISEEALALARAAKYNIISIKRGLSEERLERFFMQEGNVYFLNDNIKNMVDFKYFNLMDPFTSLGAFDFVLCRNVAIYFSAETKKDLFKKIHNLLAPQGLLLLGATESLLGYSKDFITKEFGQGIYFEAK
jgi:chemotaxis protein methyltransferase CheR